MLVLIILKYFNYFNCCETNKVSKRVLLAFVITKFFEGSAGLHF